MTAPDFAHVFDRWDTHLGDIAPEYPREAEDGFYYGVNVVRYASGHVGPRAGFKVLPVSGPSSVVEGWGVDQLGRLRWQRLGSSAVNSYDLFTGAQDSYFLTEAGYTGAGDLVPVADGSFGGSAGTVLQIRNQTTPGLATVVNGQIQPSQNANIVAGSHIAVYGERWYATNDLDGTNTTRSRVYYSDAASFLGDAVNYFEVGLRYPGDLRGLLGVPEGLFIVQGGEVWLLRGTSGVGRLDQVAARGTVGPWERPIAGRQGQVMVLGAHGDPLRWDGQTFRPVAAQFREAIGVQLTNSADHAALGVGQRSGSVLAQYGDDGLFLLQDSTNRWTQHVFASPTASRWRRIASMSERAVTQHVEGADLFVVAAADTAQFLSWQTLERPPTIDDPFVNVGFDVAPQHTFEAGLYTPVRKATAGQQFRIRRIVVRYRAWATGQGHGFTVGVGKFGARRSSTGQFASYPFRPIATVSGTDEQVEVVQSFTAPASTDSQLTIDVSDDPSEAYWVGIGSMEGVGIGAIEVYGTHEGLVL